MEERQNKTKYLKQAKHLYLKFTSGLYLRLNHNELANLGDWSRNPRTNVSLFRILAAVHFVTKNRPKNRTLP